MRIVVGRPDARGLRDLRQSEAGRECQPAERRLRWRPTMECLWSSRRRLLRRSRIWPPVELQPFPAGESEKRLPKDSRVVTTSLRSESQRTLSPVEAFEILAVRNTTGARQDRQYATSMNWDRSSGPSLHAALAISEFGVALREADCLAGCPVRRQRLKTVLEETECRRAGISGQCSGYKGSSGRKFPSLPFDSYRIAVTFNVVSRMSFRKSL